MNWNWQKPDWPKCAYNSAALEPLEKRFLLRSGEFIGAFKHIGAADQDTLKIELIGVEAVKTGQMDAVQVIDNTCDQNPEDELFPMCREMNIGVIARVPFDEGSLTGTMTHGMTWPQGDWRNLYFSPDKLPAILHHVEALREDVPSGMSMPELALRFILANPDVSTIIPGMRRRLPVDRS